MGCWDLVSAETALTRSGSAMSSTSIASTGRDNWCPQEQPRPGKEAVTMAGEKRDRKLKHGPTEHSKKPFRATASYKPDKEPRTRQERGTQEQPRPGEAVVNTAKESVSENLQRDQASTQKPSTQTAPESQLFTNQIEKAEQVFHPATAAA